MEGTVICASRAEGLVARAGSAVKVAASGRGGMARGSAWTDLEGFEAITLGFETAALATGCFAAGLPFAADAAFFAALMGAGAFLAGAFLTGVFAAVRVTGFAGAFVGGTLTTAFFAAGLAAFAAGLIAFAAGLTALVAALALGLG